MYASYGTKKVGSRSVRLYPADCNNITPPLPDKVYSDRFPRCRNCPYPRHGLFCWDEDGGCLWSDLAKIMRRKRDAICQTM
ncbi:hypothetical protein FACS1894191_6630 [Clostridia bacterium]|nr:hypothetical protein FACS1894191_6630 [Clostridia bacterium]